MTFETKYLINVSDVLGFEFECNNCKVRVAIPVDSTRTLWKCPACNEDWILPGTDEQNAIKSLLNTFKNAEKALQGRIFSLRLQITAPPKP